MKLKRDIKRILKKSIIDISIKDLEYLYNSHQIATIKVANNCLVLVKEN